MVRTVVEIRDAKNEIKKKGHFVVVDEGRGREGRVFFFLLCVCQCFGLTTKKR